MDALEYFKMLLEEVCQRLWPVGLVEIKEYPVGIWPIVLDAEGNLVPHKETNMFAQVEKVTVKINNGRRERDWVLGVLKCRHGKQFDSTPLGEDKIIIQPKDGKELFFTYEPGISGMVPIFKAGEEGENFGLSGYCEETGEQLDISVGEVVNA